MKSSMWWWNTHRTLACATVAMVTVLVTYGCANSMDGGHVLVHAPVKVEIVPFGAPCPALWTCWSKGSWTVRISEEPINIENDVGDVEIHWTIVSADWIFDKNKGIDFKNNSMWLPKEVSKIEWKALNKKRTAQVYKYMLNLNRESTGEPLSWDPTVMN